MRIYLYSVLVCAVIAAWIALSVLKVPELEPTSSAEAAFDETTTALAKEILDQRNSDLAKLSESQKIGFSGAINGAGIVGSSSDPRENMIVQNEALEFASVNGDADSGHILRPSTDLLNALDTADALYDERLEKRVEVLVPYLRESMLNLRNASMQWFVYRTLIKTLNRDIIKYKDKNSLDLREIKYDLYTENYNEVHAYRESSRAKTHAHAMELEDEVRSEYDSRLEALLDELAVQIFRDAGQNDIPAAYETLTAIKNRIYGFNAPEIGGRITGTHGPLPEIDSTSWLGSENELTIVAGNALSDDRSE